MAKAPCCLQHRPERLEEDEAERWDAYSRAVRERVYQERSGTRVGVERWKVAARAHHTRHGQITKRILFVHRQQLHDICRYYRTDWTGYVRGEAKERAEERVLVC